MIDNILDMQIDDICKGFICVLQTMFYIAYNYTLSLSIDKKHITIMHLFN